VASTVWHPPPYLWATAGPNLMASLAKEKVSHALSPAVKLELRDPHDPRFQASVFGEGMVEVRNLTDAGPGGGGVARRLQGVALMQASRAERHALTAQAWDAERVHLVEETRGSVQLAVASFRDRLSDSDADMVGPGRYWVSWRDREA